MEASIAAIKSSSLKGIYISPAVANVYSCLRLLVYVSQSILVAVVNLE
uniref:Uncharacterized protein n=1 Tax=Siphoviridae sp. ctsf32 TaxID=2827594 RepID=A0A8S5LNE0_9CAUD|nr:MAG TPA: hypothetical protein [Siphoviridae sp. ctsf32]